MYIKCKNTQGVVKALEVLVVCVNSVASVRHGVIAPSQTLRACSVASHYAIYLQTSPPPRKHLVKWIYRLCNGLSSTNTNKLK